MLPINEITSTIIWYFLLQLIGLLTLPICFFSFKNLKDHGYTISKILGIILFSFIIFVLSRYFRLPYNKFNILLSIFIFSVVSVVIFKLIKRNDTVIISKDFLRYVVITETIFLALFLFLIFIKTFSPDADGGEAVMDFSFLNSILRDNKLPSNYPWFSGENLESLYYYFGHFMTANLIKLTNINPGIGYNLAMISFFSIFSLGCFGIIYNLTESKKFALLTILILAFMGNLYGLLHIINTLFPGLNILMPSYNPAKNGNLFQKLTGRGDSDLFWWSTRVIPWTITEIPWFSFLWGDLHAHFVSYQIIVLFFTICLNFFISENVGIEIFGIKRFEKIINIILISICLGVMFPQFIWNYPLYAGFTGFFIISGEFLTQRKFNFKAWVKIFFVIILIILLSVVLFLPSFKSLLNSKSGGRILPENLKTSSYHFLAILFLQWFLISAFIISKISKFEIFKRKKHMIALKINILLYFLLVFILVISFFQDPQRFFSSDLKFRFNLKYILLDFQMLWILGPIILFSLILLLTKKLEEKESFIFLLIIFGSLIFLGSEIYSIHGRYVFFFKMFPSIWISWGIASVYCLYYFRHTKNKIFRFFIIFLLIFSLVPYFLIATFNVTEGFRYSFGRNYPSIDALAFMKIIHKNDYEAIKWLNENIDGTPIIMEYIGNEYTYASRVSSFTGLPTLVGWRFHSSQLAGVDVSERENDVHHIYNTTEIEFAVNLTEKNKIKYIFIGELEKQNYPEEGLKKFYENNNYYDLVYNNSETQIYEFKTQK